MQKLIRETLEEEITEFPGRAKSAAGLMRTPLTVTSRNINATKYAKSRHISPWSDQSARQRVRKRGASIVRGYFVVMPQRDICLTDDLFRGTQTVQGSTA